MSSEDSLQDIPDTDLPLLKKLYEKYQNTAPHVFNLFQICIDWKLKKKSDGNLYFYGVDNDWLETGTFILVFEYHMYDLFFYTLEEDHAKLYTALIKTKKINWDKKVIWFSLSGVHAPILLKIAKTIRHHHNDLLHGSLWSLDTRKALQFSAECPNDLYVGKLNKSHAAIVNEHWTYHSDGTEGLIRSFIEVNISIGLFLKSNDELVCWVLLNEFGMISNLQTLPGYERKGYATYVTKMISKKMANHGFIPQTCIMDVNVVSQKFFTKLGFKKYDTCVFLTE